MVPVQNQDLSSITSSLVQVTDRWMDYWEHYSNMTTWQFWFNLAMLVIPLVVLYFRLDWRRAFHIGFYGFNVHVWFSYIDAFGVGHGLWTYPYRVIPFLPISFALDVSFVPVVYMLAYQWTINQNKNYYLYLTGICAIFAFVLKPIFVALNLFHPYQRMIYFYLFIGYVVIMLLSKWITDIFIHFENRGTARGSLSESVEFRGMKKGLFRPKVR